MKTTKTITNLTMVNTRVKLSPRLTLALTLFCTSLAQAAPVGGVVTTGTASISSAGSNTTINQSSSKAAINWQSFNVGANESVRFNQPSSSSITLNRITGADGSSIMGKLSANGRVFLINPNGILFGAGSQVNVGGMVASTLGITDRNFLAGNYRFSGDSAASISNHGNIATNVDGGYIALLGANVSNTGVINARLGTVALAAGNGLTLDVAGDRLLNIHVDQGAVNALVSNGHLIMADGGQVLMTARGASNLLSNAVNNTGLIQAQSITNSNGLIVLSAGPDAGVVNVSGSLDASGTRAGQTGGLVQLLGGTVNLTAANVNVSGNAGGGQALVGGNFHGAGPQANALFTNIDGSSSINADALQTGNGGKIAVWSDNTTLMGGTLTARGGSLSGDGGFIETSGKYLTISDTAYVNTLATNGKAGMWLLDPINWTIAIAGGDETPTQVATSLASSARTIDATNDITVSDAITWSTPQTLTLDAGNDININAAITGSTAGARLNLMAGHDVLIASTGTLTTSGAANQINITATNNITAPTATLTSSTAASNQVNLTAGSDISVGVITTTGSTSLISGNSGTGSGTVTIGTVTGPSTLIRFNPATYANTDFEVAAYNAKIFGTVGTTDVKAWVFLQGNNKVYDQSVADTLSFKGTPTNASAVTLTAGTASFANKNVGVGKAVTYSGYSLGGIATNLALFSASGTTTANITPAPLVVSATGTNKVYDATTSASATLSTAPIAGDTVVASYTAAGFLTKNVGTSKPVDVSGITLSGADAGNYTANTTVATTANITPAPLVVSATGTNKVYDATTSASATLSAAPIAGDTVVASYTAAGFLTKNVGTSKPVDVSGITLSGADAGNYTANTTVATTANITPAPLVVSATGTNKVYDGTTSDTVTLYANPIAGDVANSSYTSANFSNAFIGVNKPVSVLGIALTGADAGNYNYNTTATTTASITSGGAPNPTPSGVDVVPISPPGITSKAPVALQEDIRSGATTPSVIPIAVYDAGDSNLAVIPITTYGVGGGGSIIGSQGSNQSNMLIVAIPQRGPEMQSLFPAPVIAPTQVPKQDPKLRILAPKQGRN